MKPPGCSWMRLLLYVLDSDNSSLALACHWGLFRAGLSSILWSLGTLNKSTFILHGKTLKFALPPGSWSFAKTYSFQCNIRPTFSGFPDQIWDFLGHSLAVPQSVKHVILCFSTRWRCAHFQMLYWNVKASHYHMWKVWSGLDDVSVIDRKLQFIIEFHCGAMETPHDTN